MNITEKENPYLKIEHVKMNADHLLNPNFVSPLPDKSGFSWVILGARQSGKTNYCVDLLNKGKVKDKETNEIKQIGYKKIFNQIFVVSPSMHTIDSDKNPFKYLTDEWKSKEFSIDTLELFEELCKEKHEEAEENDQEPPFILLVLDDIGSQIRKNKPLETKFSEFIFNIRHRYRCSVIMLLQHSAQIPPAIKANITHLTTFKPKTKKERENILENWLEVEPKHLTQFFNHVFRKDRDTLFIDMTTNNRKYYRNFNELNF